MPQSGSAGGEIDLAWMIPQHLRSERVDQFLDVGRSWKDPVAEGDPHVPRSARAGGSEKEDDT